MLERSHVAHGVRYQAIGRVRDPPERRALMLHVLRLGRLTGGVELTLLRRIAQAAREWDSHNALTRSQQVERVCWR
jgi:hypothetical protein